MRLPGGHGVPSISALAIGLALVLLVLALPGCNSSSPTEPSTGPDGLTIVFDDPNNLLGGRSAVIRREIERAFVLAADRISIEGLVARVNADLARVIPGYGLGGFAHGPNEVEIAVDPAATEALIVERMPWIAVHEFHHAARFRGPGYGNTLLQAMVSEGLADHFAFELFGPPRAPWTTALAGDELETWLDRARAEFDSTRFDFAAWFFGTGGEIPVWAGYAIGFRLVSDYKDANRDATAASLVHTPAGAFRPD